MKKIILSLVAIALISVNVQAQKFGTRAGKVYFSATSSAEKIEATSTSTKAVLDLASNRISIAMPIKSFEFKDQLMEDHFNEKYMESGKFPEAKFDGTLSGFATTNLKKDGTYTVNVAGKLTMHGITKDVKTTAKLTVKGGNISVAEAQFKVLVADYEIKVPTPVRDKIAKEATISVTLNLTKL